MKTTSSLAKIITETILSSITPENPPVSTKTEVISPAALPELASTKQAPHDVVRTVRCKECENCKRDNCGQCVYCKDMIKFGGRNSMRRSCALRKCTQVGPQSCTYVLICADCLYREAVSDRYILIYL